MYTMGDTVAATDREKNHIQTLIFEIRGYQRKYFDDHEDFTKPYEEVLAEIRDLVKQYIYTKHQISIQMPIIMKEIISRYMNYIGDIMPIINGLVQSLLNALYPSAWI